jgi:hypothetical protein
MAVSLATKNDRTELTTKDERGFQNLIEATKPVIKRPSAASHHFLSNPNCSGPH